MSSWGTSQGISLGIYSCLRSLRVISLGAKRMSGQTQFQMAPTPPSLGHCGSLSENASPPTPVYLNTWIPICEGLGGVAFLEEVCPGARL